MRTTRGRLRTLAALACLSATGCATMRELPRGEYAARPERKGVVVDTHEGLHYRFDVAHFSPDTLVGERLRDTEGAFAEYNTIAIPLESVAKLQVRQTSWLRTGAIAGGVAVAAITAVVSRKGSSSTPDTGPVLPPPIDP